MYEYTEKNADAEKTNSILEKRVMPQRSGRQHSHFGAVPTSQVTHERDFQERERATVTATLRKLPRSRAMKSPSPIEAPRHAVATFNPRLSSQGRAPVLPGSNSCAPDFRYPLSRTLFCGAPLRSSDAMLSVSLERCAAMKKKKKWYE